MTKYTIPVYTITTYKEIEADDLAAAITELEEAGDVINYKGLLDKVINSRPNFISSPTAAITFEYWVNTYRPLYDPTKVTDSMNLNIIDQSSLQKYYLYYASDKNDQKIIKRSRAAHTWTYLSNNSIENKYYIVSGFIDSKDNAQVIGYFVCYKPVALTEQILVETLNE